MGCRSCLLAEREYLGDQVHQEVDQSFICFFCGYSDRCIIHPETEQFLDRSYECIKCNNYIIYISGKCQDTIYKDEIYFSNGCALTRNLETNKSYFCSDFPLKDKLWNDLPLIVIGSSEQELLEKIDLYLTFSQYT